MQFSACVCHRHALCFPCFSKIRISIKCSIPGKPNQLCNTFAWTEIALIPARAALAACMHSLFLFLIWATLSRLFALPQFGMTAVLRITDDNHSTHIIELASALEKFPPR
jgi:hypothetical protein